MKVHFNQETDTLRILLSSKPIAESDEEKPGVIIDYDAEGNLVGLEILDASQRVDDPRDLDHDIS